jgi:large subunit ribosomal protein L51
VRQLKLYSPASPWAEHRALEGQNDYIDLLGNDDIHPKQIMYHVPHYLRGVHQ